MWLMFTRAPTPDAPYWPGRRWLAAVDALAWPALWVLAMRGVPAHAGLIGTAVSVLALCAGAKRLHIAVWRNHRYRFTTWRWGRALLCMAFLGWALKVVVAMR